MPTKNPEIQTTFVVATPHNPTTMQSPNICKTYWVLPSTLKVRITEVWDSERINLTLMVAAVLTLIWRQVPSVQELPDGATGIVVGKSSQSLTTSIVTKVSQFSSRAVWACFSWLAATVTSTLAPKAKRPLPVAVKYAHKHFENIWLRMGQH